ncbi:hypothetical protein Strain138_000229 [Pseudogemmatithrix spongiicola]|uniref:Tetratricopeptide repeat protein n=1 Tax=Pseudogemmatithrix spongiicola TaxID=3062599 RepID=A0AA49Q7B3_9BACT|nr:hypothetical protein Strain138_000229 [Gemmatimonadaceae bacterium 'strain 138']WKW13905.1 hypothetical protein Strain318_000229 [Gemmatimonadaceae bacterium 'strain 318']
MLARHVTDPVPPIRTVRRVPAALEEVALRALAKTPADRWPSARAFADALERAATADAERPTVAAAPWWRSRVAQASALAALVLVAVSVGQLVSTSAGRAPRAMSLAIVPFSFEGTPEKLVYADGLANDLVVGLVRENLRVSDPARMEQFRGSSLDPVMIGDSLGVDAILSATVRVAGNAIGVFARLTDVKDGELLWAEQFAGELETDGKLADPSTIVRDLNERILISLLPRLGNRAGQPPRGLGTDDARAYEEYQHGIRALRDVRLGGASLAQRHFELALARDPAFADAWIGLATALDQLLQLSSQAPTSLISRLQEALARASSLDSLHPDLILLRARTRLMFDFDQAGYDREMIRGIRRYANNASLHFGYGQDLHIIGLPDSGIAEVRRAVALEPNHPFRVGYLGSALAATGRADEARVYIDRALAMDSTLWLSWLDRAVLASHAGRPDEAERFAARALDLQANSPWMVGWYLQCAGAATPGTRQRIYEQLLQSAQSGATYVQRVFLAHSHLAMGQTARALDELEASLRVRDRDLFASLGWGVFEQLRGEPRYERVLDAVGLGPAIRRSRGGSDTLQRGICRTSG